MGFYGLTAMSENNVERYPCDKCGKESDGIDLIPVEIPITGEIWDLCDPCVDDLVDWIEGDDA